MGSRKRVWTVLRKWQNSVEMGSEICNKIKSQIFHSKTIPNVLPPECVLWCLPALAWSIHQCCSSNQNLHQALDQMAPILLAQSQHSPSTCQVELAAYDYLNFTFFVIVHHADNFFVFFPIQSRTIIYVQSLHFFLAHYFGPVKPFTGPCQTVSLWGEKPGLYKPPGKVTPLVLTEDTIKQTRGKSARLSKVLGACFYSNSLVYASVRWHCQSALLCASGKLRDGSSLLWRILNLVMFVAF